MLWYCAMLMKLLLTLLVIIAALVTLRLRKRHPRGISLRLLRNSIRALGDHWCPRLQPTGCSVCC